MEPNLQASRSDLTKNSNVNKKAEVAEKNNSKKSKMKAAVNSIVAEDGKNSNSMMSGNSVAVQATIPQPTVQTPVQVTTQVQMPVQTLPIIEQS